MSKNPKGSLVVALRRSGFGFFYVLRGMVKDGLEDQIPRSHVSLDTVVCVCLSFWCFCSEVGGGDRRMPENSQVS